MDDTQTTLQELLKVTSKLVGQVESIDKRMDKIENVVANDVRQDERIASIESSLHRGSEKFAALEQRIGVLEDADGNKAKQALKTVGNYLLTAIAGFIISAIGFYIMNKK
jgi:predicted  nucleic acid-binding Zn-ribbon protein